MSGLLNSRGMGQQRPLSVIVDGRLALSAFGLLVSLRLAGCATTWLVRALWSLLDNDQFFQERPDLIDDGSDGRNQAKMLSEWRNAWLQAKLLDKFFWIGDARHDSLLPSDIPDGSVERFEALSRHLDDRIDGERDRSPLGECARDAACLAALLAASGAPVLTPLDPDSEPRFCTMLADAGIDCRQISDNDVAARFSAEILPPLALMMCQQLGFGGHRIAAVHLLAPRAVFSLRSGEDDFDWAPEAVDGDLWSGSSAYWHVLG